MRLWLRCSAWLCLSLMLWTAAAESTHNHPNQTEANSCPICVVAHTASPAYSCSHTAPVFAAVGILQEEAVLAKASSDVAHRGIRGPPTT
ncbi:MAG TPA: hypothetical protein VMD99_01495 [Terriglobales bacterium]|nr:hypothetical protein [Terriglobales bacterium]